MFFGRGEKSHGNSLQFRHAELKAALCTVLDVENLDLEYSNALSTSFDASIEMSEYQTEVYQNAMQYVKVIQNYASNEGLHMPNIEISNDKWVEAVQRCSLIRLAHFYLSFCITSRILYLIFVRFILLLRGLYEISAMGDSIENLATSALRHHSFDDMFSSGLNNNATWRVRLRQYGSAASASKSKQYGKKMRSPMRQERESVYKLKDLLIKIKGEVDLKNAEISIYILEGLMTPHGEEKGKFLARQLAKGGMFEDGKSMSTIAPTSRICVTNTPLAPIEAFTVCNIARIRDGHRVLDPFCGSCTTLLAASMLATRSVLSVGIEIAHNGQVNREHIVKDFKRRNLIAPAALIHGDSMDPIIRNDALSAVGNKPFDCIVTDPPYGKKVELLIFCLRKFRFYMTIHLFCTIYYIPGTCHLRNS